MAAAERFERRAKSRARGAHGRCVWHANDHLGRLGATTLRQLDASSDFVLAQGYYNNFDNAFIFDTISET